MHDCHAIATRKPEKSEKVRFFFYPGENLEYSYKLVEIPRIE